MERFRLVSGVYFTDSFLHVRRQLSVQIFKFISEVFQESSIKYSTNVNSL